MRWMAGPYHVDMKKLSESAAVQPLSDAETQAERWGRPAAGWRLACYRVIFESDTRAGRLFDQLLVLLILASLVVVVADSVEALQARFGPFFDWAEWVFTGLFTLEYLLRLACINRPWRYARSFFGLVDLLALLPTYLALLVPGLHALIDIRVLRLLRVFRIFKLMHFVVEYQAMGGALLASRRKILVFVSVVAMIVVVMGTLMYVIEGPANGYTSILTGIYWAATTMTTTGFGDITPKTELGRAITTFMMLLGWGTLAVPTGIVTAEMTARRIGTAADEGGKAGAGPDGAATYSAPPRLCHSCGGGGHVAQARFCLHCGSRL
ncbi:MAG: hypothetical protein RJA36_674 [Pseudomonadota bacterium]